MLSHEKNNNGGAWVAFCSSFQAFATLPHSDHRKMKGALLGWVRVGCTVYLNPIFISLKVFSIHILGAVQNDLVQGESALNLVQFYKTDA